MDDFHIKLFNPGRDGLLHHAALPIAYITQYYTIDQTNGTGHVSIRL